MERGGEDRETKRRQEWGGGRGQGRAVGRAGPMEEEQGRMVVVVGGAGADEECCYERRKRDGQKYEGRRKRPRGVGGN